MRCFVVCSFAAVIALAGVARAQGGGDSLELPNPRLDPSPEVKPSSRAWYGYQTLLADAVFIGVFASTPYWPTFDGAGALIVMDVVAFSATAPIIHALHDNTEGGAASLGLHAGLPFLGMWIGFGAGLLSPCTCGPGAWLCFCHLSDAGLGAYSGILVGAGLAAIFDAAFLAFQRREPTASSSTASWSIAPYALSGGGGLSASCVF